MGFEAARPERKTGAGRPVLAHAAPASARRALAQPGNAIENGLRREMEARFRHDFSRVRVHSGPEADVSAGDLRAAAYTAGISIVFGRNKYSPRTAAGKRLLAHELAHVVQQREATSILPAISPARDASELAAERLADGGAERPSVASAVPALQRQPAAPTGLPDKPAGDNATDQEVVAALTAFLSRVLQTQGGRGLLRDSPVVWQALHVLAGSDSSAFIAVDNFLQSSQGGSPAAFARQAREHLPPGIPRSALERLNTIPSAPSASGGPGSMGETLDQFVDRTFRPLINSLTKSEDLRRKLLEAAHAGVRAGVVGLANAAMTNLDPQARATFSAALDATIRQRTSRAQVPATSPFTVTPPPSGVPGTLPPAPGQQIIPSPSVPIPDTPGQAPPAPSVPAAPASVDQVIQGLADDALIPAEARGKPVADSLTSARAFARALADKLDEAQRKGQGSVELTLSSAYGEVGDIRAVFDEAEWITQLIKNALPHGASKVEQVIVTVESPDPKKPSFRRDVIQLH